MGVALCRSPWTVLCDEQRGDEIVTCLYISHRRDGLEAGLAIPTMPNMIDLPLIAILGPYGGNQFLAALNALHPKGRTTIGYHRRHGNLPEPLPPTDKHYHDSQHRRESF